MLTAWQQMISSLELCTIADVMKLPKVHCKGLTYAARCKGACKCHKLSCQKTRTKAGAASVPACSGYPESTYHSQRREEPCTSVMTMLTSLDTSPNCSAKPSFRVPGGCLCHSILNISRMTMNAWSLVPCCHCCELGSVRPANL